MRALPCDKTPHRGGYPFHVAVPSRHIIIIIIIVISFIIITIIIIDRIVENECVEREYRGEDGETRVSVVVFSERMWKMVQI